MDSRSTTMMQKRFSLLLLSLLLLLAACNRQPPAPPEPEGEPATQARVTATNTGLFRVDAETLASLGWRPADPLTLTYGGDPYPYQADESGLYFYLPERAGTQYSTQHVLWLTYGEAQPAPETASGGDELSTIVAEQKLESDEQHNSKYVGNPWFWKSLIAPTTDEHALQTPGRQEGPVSVTVRAAGVTNLPHQITVQLNGEEAGTLEWQGDDRHEESFSLDLPAGDNLEIALVLSGSEGDISLLDEIVVSYPSAPVGNEGTVRGLSEQGGVARFQGIGETALAWQLAPEVAPLAVTAGDGGPQVTLPANQPFIVMDRQSAQPATVEAAEARAIPAAGAAYVAVVGPDLLEPLQPLLDLHRAEGLTVMALTPQQVYDAYTHGNVDPLAFQMLLADGQENWVEKPRFLLLVGDSTYDPAGYLDEPPASYLPSPLISTVFGGETVSDNVIADLNADGYPEVALGRLPARSAEQLNTIVQKIVAYSENPMDGDWRQRVVLTADGREALFEQNSENLRSAVPSGVEVQAVYPGTDGNAMEQIVPALNEGSLVVNYVGHGSVQQWGRDQLLTVEAVQGLSNGARLPIYINMTCLTGLFSHPSQESLGETLLWAPDGGAIATIVPSSLTLPSNQTQFNQTLIAELLSPERPTIGEALMRAKQSVTLGTQNDHDIVATFNLLGDPALRPAPMISGATTQNQ